MTTFKEAYTKEFKGLLVDLIKANEVKKWMI